jgi:hypothetical protein
MQNINIIHPVIIYHKQRNITFNKFIALLLPSLIFGAYIIIYAENRDLLLLFNSTFLFV